MNGKGVLRVMRERRLLGRQRRLRVSRGKDWGKVEALHPNHVWQSDMTKICAGPMKMLWRRSTARAEGFAFRFSWNGLTLTTDNGAQFTLARYVETRSRLGITHRRTAYNPPEGDSYIERFHAA